MLKSYIGTKIIRAEPMDEDAPGEPNPGYRVVYPDGYESWSPKYVFEQAYREITDAEKILMAGDK